MFYDDSIRDEAEAMRQMMNYNWALTRCLDKYGDDFKPADILYEMNHQLSDDDVDL